MEQNQEIVNKAGEEETENSSGNTFGWTTEDQAQYIHQGNKLLAPVVYFAGP